ncbi:hypothetical protein RhiirC2_835861, partial [Rhizophagus irregularis]
EISDKTNKSTSKSAPTKSNKQKQQRFQEETLSEGSNHQRERMEEESYLNEMSNKTNKSTIKSAPIKLIFKSAKLTKLTQEESDDEVIEIKPPNIPKDGYNVKTEIADQMLYCETKYTLANKKTNRKKYQISGVHVFGFDIKILHQLRIEQPRELSTDKITIDKRKRPLNEIQSLSQQNKRYASFGRDAYKKVKNLILKHRMVSESEEPICICRLDQQSILDDDDEPQGNPDGIIVDEQEVGNGVYQSV